MVRSQKYVSIEETHELNDTDSWNSSILCFLVCISELIFKFSQTSCQKSLRFSLGRSCHC